jgi:hypothetical protein
MFLEKGSFFFISDSTAIAGSAEQQGSKGARPQGPNEEQKRDPTVEQKLE